MGCLLITVTYLCALKYVSLGASPRHEGHRCSLEFQGGIFWVYGLLANHSDLPLRPKKGCVIRVTSGDVEERCRVEPHARSEVAVFRIACRLERCEPSLYHQVEVDIGQTQIVERSRIMVAVNSDSSPIRGPILEFEPGSR
jgi:hypothetical protein